MTGRRRTRRSLRVERDRVRVGLRSERFDPRVYSTMFTAHVKLVRRLRGDKGDAPLELRRDDLETVTDRWADRVMAHAAERDG